MTTHTAPLTQTESPGDTGPEVITIQVPRGTSLEMRFSNPERGPKDSSTLSCCTGSIQQVLSTILETVDQINPRSLIAEAMDGSFEDDPLMAVTAMVVVRMKAIVMEAYNANQS